MNRLYFGDNLAWLRSTKELPDASVDLVYLDPPFNSNADYNVLFRETSGEVSQAQFHAFTDTWSWADAAAFCLTGFGVAEPDRCERSFPNCYNPFGSA